MPKKQVGIRANSPLMSHRSRDFKKSIDLVRAERTISPPPIVPSASSSTSPDLQRERRSPSPNMNDNKEGEFRSASPHNDLVFAPTAMDIKKPRATRPSFEPYGRPLTPFWSKLMQLLTWSKANNKRPAQLLVLVQTEVESSFAGGKFVQRIQETRDQLRGDENTQWNDKLIQQLMFDLQRL